MPPVAGERDREGEPLRARLAEAEETILQLKARIADLVTPKRIRVYRGLGLSRSEKLIVAALLEAPGPLPKARLRLVLSRRSWLDPSLLPSEAKGVDVLICRLRKKLNAVKGLDIQTIWGEGYFLTAGSRTILESLDIGSAAQPEPFASRSAGGIAAAVKSHQIAGSPS